MQINIPTERLTETGNKIASKVKSAKSLHPKRIKYILAAIILIIIALIVITNWPKATPPVYPRVEGYLEQMHFEEGRYIKKNDILFTIDPKLYKALGGGWQPAK